MVICGCTSVKFEGEGLVQCPAIGTGTFPHIATYKAMYMAYSKVNKAQNAGNVCFVHMQSLLQSPLQTLLVGISKSTVYVMVAMLAPKNVAHCTQPNSGATLHLFKRLMHAGDCAGAQTGEVLKGMARHAANLVTIPAACGSHVPPCAVLLRKASTLRDAIYATMRRVQGMAVVPGSQELGLTFGEILHIAWCGASISSDGKGVADVHQTKDAVRKAVQRLTSFETYLDKLRHQV